MISPKKAQAQHQKWMRKQLRDMERQVDSKLVAHPGRSVHVRDLGSWTQDMCDELVRRYERAGWNVQNHTGCGWSEKQQAILIGPPLIALDESLARLAAREAAA